MKKPMELNSRKLAAITTAVVTYIKTQEEAAAWGAQESPAPEPMAAQASIPAVFPAINAWGTAGRTDQMQGRSLMQLRVFR
jgi:hypothetical protein